MVCCWKPFIDPVKANQVERFHSFESTHCKIKVNGIWQLIWDWNNSSKTVTLVQSVWKIYGNIRFPFINISCKLNTSLIRFYLLLALMRSGYLFHRDLCLFERPADISTLSWPFLIFTTLLINICRLTQRLKNDLTLSVYVSFPILWNREGFLALTKNPYVLLE